MEKRKTSFFEKSLLVVGISVLVLGYLFITARFDAEGRELSWEFMQTLFLWSLIVIIIIMIAYGEDIKEGILLKQLEELREVKALLNKRK